MTTAQNVPSSSRELAAFVAQVKRDAEHAGRVLRETGTLSATNTFAIAQRVPAHLGQDLLVSTSFPDIWSKGEVATTLSTFDGKVLDGDGGGGGGRYVPVFRERPEIDTVIHVHTPHLGAYSSAHRTLKILYVAAQRHTFSREIPIYVDRRPSEASFILDALRKDPHVPAILEANGGATFWGKSVIAVSKYILLLEEAARFQLLAEPLGGSQEYGPAVLEQQWRMTGLLGAAS